ncbi:PREDICTED: uncharacterized protein LOC108574044 isoform X2 [Habropoda laboriosa]|uniref:uncharacterized protein LOC108574044 isoform X2 n=1 Tax=Habropoda laboriosa TaxID=597456 RepID=UPI00083D42D0|nr:PREDICTED: uncharacterized protein LOC108574044 isoform X2 [Habropoda laboriosa]
MGQAWCKEKTSKAQDSKSPLDRVFVRCAHRIYPSLKEEGSVLGGATQRVTSSEIGYAGSPPREVLTRGRSIDSVDRPFHPSDWVDVNLEVPSTPRPSSALTNLTVDTSLYPATTTTPTSSCSNLKDVTPIPPPRRRKRNKGRPLPPKPDEITAENPANGQKRPETGDEPLYSSVRSPKSSGDEQDTEEEGKLDKHRSEDAERDGRRMKEIYEHKVNGTGRIISSDVVSGKRIFEINQQQQQQQQRKAHENDEYEKFARNRTSKDSSTPNREEKKRPREVEKQMKDFSRDAEETSSNARTKNYSTVSLPNYDELDVARHRSKGNEDGHEQQEDKTRRSRRPVRSSTGSLPAESFLSPFSEKTSVRLEDYIPRSANLSSYQVLEKLECGPNGVVKDSIVKYDPSKSDDWELADTDACELNHPGRFSFEDFQDIATISEDKKIREDEEDVVDFSNPREDERGGARLDRDGSRSPIYLQKPEAFGKTPSPVLGEPEYTEVDPNRSHLRYFEPPKLPDTCNISSVCESTGSKEPFFLDETKHRSALDTIVLSSGERPESDRSDQSRMMFTRSLSNESEPNEDAYESKDLHCRSSGLIRTISEESLPREMLEEQELDKLFDEKLAKDVHNKLKKSMDDWKTNTPPPSPEPRIKSELLDSDHSTLLKVLKEEAAEESNLSSMTPSLTELEAALSDMLEKEESHEGTREENKSGVTIEKPEFHKHSDGSKDQTGGSKMNDQILVEQESNREVPTCLKQIQEDKKPANKRKVSFCSWEESVAETEARNVREFIEDSMDLDKKGILRLDEDGGFENMVVSMDVPPEKPSRLNRSLEDLMENTEIVPTPPRRRNRSVGVARKEPEMAQNGTAITEALPNDRLI